jgi:hypothetical protein
MRWLASLFVGKPLNILAVAAIFLAVHVVLRAAGKAGGRLHRPTLVAAAAWGLYAAWEWLVQARTPEADIRVDLLLIWPVLALISAWAVIRAFRSAGSAGTTSREKGV